MSTVLQKRFLGDVLSNPNNARILERWDALQLPDGWLVAGCLFQSVWNRIAGRPAADSIKDYDLFYFDPADLSEDAERAVQRRAQAVLADLPITVEACNQARVHLWYPEHFGHPYPPLQDARDGIRRFLVPATCVGVSPTALFAPNGLELIYQGVLSMNPLTPYRDLFEAKVASYRKRWPWLRSAVDG